MYTWIPFSFEPLASSVTLGLSEWTCSVFTLCSWFILCGIAWQNTIIASSNNIQHPSVYIVLFFFLQPIRKWTRSCCYVLLVRVQQWQNFLGRTTDTCSALHFILHWRFTYRRSALVFIYTFLCCEIRVI